jgi:hypothetical protein
MSGDPISNQSRLAKAGRRRYERQLRLDALRQAVCEPWTDDGAMARPRHVQLRLEKSRIHVSPIVSRASTSLPGKKVMSASNNAVYRPKLPIASEASRRFTTQYARSGALDTAVSDASRPLRRTIGDAKQGLTATLRTPRARSPGGPRRVTRSRARSWGGARMTVAGIRPSRSTRSRGRGAARPTPPS